MQRLIPTGDAARPVAFAEVPRPVPGPGEALVKAEAFAPNRGEAFLLEHPRPGLLPGKEQGRLHPETGRVADRAGTAATLVGLRERRIRGKAVLLIGGAR